MVIVQGNPQAVHPFVEGGQRFLSYLRSRAARRFFEAQGFTVIGEGASQ